MTIRGSKPGEHRGGRTKGTPNRATAAKAAEIAASGQTPLDYMIQVMRDPTVDAGRRDEMARAAAPYVHPKLAATEHKANLGSPIQVVITGSDRGLL
jgi:hypothetical protein